MTDQNIHEGGCLCGDVRYRTKGDTTIVGVCHCRYCQLRAGSAFGLLVYFTEANVTVISGDLKPYAFVSESGKHWENQFCAKCGTTIFIRLEIFPEQVGIAGGTFDPPSFWYELDGEVFTRSKAHFVGDIEAKNHEPTFFSYDPKKPDAARLMGTSEQP